ncbi:MAG TPA: protein translocase subunit SecF [Leptospiraceae bacterium]|nr:protein translocase subunit SecF [Leptospirales bacterium]HMU82683.1 protein translocase subunit SecF [Leptospiraceae bacterium]HMX58140.1 protein translocase subunit SecF [Leptospiraceae bacterium]HMY44888.1 protein translocase subunit SecF [Leptospiraceae bacterium]HNL00809.1 protein translocase subunit SecF [Leptospiraceae bacterium]
MKFSRFRAVFILGSLALGAVLFYITFFVYGGFQSSITFNGGIRFSLVLPAGLGKADLEKAALKAGVDNPQIKLSGFRTNQYDLEIGPKTKEKLEKELAALKPSEKPKGDGGVTAELESRILGNLGLTPRSVVSRETMAASYGDELWRISLWSLFWCIIIIGIYLSFRFDFAFALGASLSLVHDVILTIGFIGVARIEPSIPVVAAVLTIVGYSINDTIVIFDRIRENSKDRAQMSLRTTMDEAMTQTLSRTLVTSILTMISVLALLLGGADSLRDFALVLIFGIFMGTYSSIFVAAHSVQYYEEFVARIRR